jgi:hypothetical protein
VLSNLSRNSGAKELSHLEFVFWTAAEGQPWLRELGRAPDCGRTIQPPSPSVARLRGFVQNDYVF